MRIESNLQKKIKKWLTEQGAVVLKTAPGVLNPTGIPDLLILYQSRWAMIEVKADAKAERQPLQGYQIDRFERMNPNLVYIVYPENWEETKPLLSKHLFLLDTH